MFDSWKKVTISDIAEVVRGASPRPQGDPRYYGGAIPRLMVADVTRDGRYVTPRIDFLTEEGAKLSRPMPAGTLTIVCSGDVGTPAFLAVDACIHDGFLALKNIADDVLPDYIYEVIASLKSRLERSATHGGVFTNLTTDILKDFSFILPSRAEQRSIATILQTWDEAVSVVEVISQRLHNLQTSLCLNTFERPLSLEGETSRASSLFEPISERARPDLPLLAVMQDVGIVRRDSLDRRVAMPDSDTTSYKVVRPGDFVISLRSFEGGLEYSNVLGLVSPAYTVLRSVRQINGDYYRHFFKSRSFIGRLDKLIFGIRDGKQISFRDFGDMRIPNPSLAEQETSATVLNDIACQIQMNEMRRKLLEAQKRGLMQKLLTGAWRVKA